MGGGMNQVPLTRGYVALVDDVDLSWALGLRWRALVQGNTETPRVYAVGDARRMHRSIWERANGQIPMGMEIDHIEPGQHGGLDNRRLNLRLCTKAQNQANSRRGRNNTSGFKGVWFQKQTRRWRADVMVGGKKQHVGYFDTPEAAAMAYDYAAVRAFGDHARVNFGRVS